MKIDPEGEMTEQQLLELSKNSIEAVVKNDEQTQIVQVLAEALCKIVIGMCGERGLQLVQRNESILIETPKKILRSSTTRKFSSMESSCTSLERDISIKEEVRISVPELKKLLRKDNKDVDLLLLLFCLKEEDLNGEKYDDFFQRIVKKEKIRHKEQELEIRQRAKRFLQKNLIGGTTLGDQSKLLSTWEKRLSMALEKFKSQNERGKMSGLFENDAEADVENQSHIKDLIRVRRRSMIQDFKGFEELNLEDSSPKVHLREPYPKGFANKVK